MTSKWQPPLMAAGEAFAKTCVSSHSQNVSEHDTLSYALCELASSLHYAGFSAESIQRALRRASEASWANKA